MHTLQQKTRAIASILFLYISCRTQSIYNLADKSVKIPWGIIKDVLIKVDKFYFLVDFIVLDTEPVYIIGSEISVILGRPFLATANTLINCRSGVMKISFGNMTMG